MLITQRSPVAVEQGVPPGSNIIVILVEQGTDDDGNPVTLAPGRYAAVLADVQDASGTSLEPPYAQAATMHIALPRSDTDADVLQFVRQMAGMRAIYVLPDPRAAAPTSTAIPPTATPKTSN